MTHRISLPQAFLASLLTHLAVLGMLYWAQPFIHPGFMKPSVLLAEIHTRSSRSETPAADATSPPPAEPTSASAASNEKAETQTIPPRFVSPPNFALLQDMPLSIGGSAQFKLYVTRLGNVAKVEIVRSTPAPKPLLDGIVEELYRTKLSPAQSPDGTAAGTLDITVHFEPSLELVAP